MAVYVVDAEAAIELAGRGHPRGGGGHQLFAPTLLRSQVLAMLRTDVAAGRSEPAAALALAEAACRLPRRLLGDAVLRANAWKIADAEGWSDTYEAEYIALTRLHGEALVAGNEALRGKASHLVPTMTVDEYLEAT